jgi:hypothetical protein
LHLAAGAGRRIDRVTRVEQDGAAALHISFDAVERFLRGLCGVRRHRPINQREEGQFVARRIETDRIAGLKRGALRQKQRKAL